MVDALERLPELGDEVPIETGVLRVERVDGSRISRLCYLPEAAATALNNQEPTHG